MADLDEFTVASDTHTVYCSFAAISWGYACSDDNCPIRIVVCFDDMGHVAQGAVGHLRWHADGMRMCRTCDSTLGPDEPGTRCAPGTCPAEGEDASRG